jgi:hypothetical protein
VGQAQEKAVLTGKEIIGEVMLPHLTSARAAAPAVDQEEMT